MRSLPDLLFKDIGDVAGVNKSTQEMEASNELCRQQSVEKQTLPMPRVTLRCKLEGR